MHRELIEYDWNEQTNLSTYTYETTDGAIQLATAIHPLAKPVATSELRGKYFADLKHWLKTQDVQ